MAYLNRVDLIGNIGKDVEVKTFENGGKLGRTSIAVTKRWKKENGEKGEKTTWVNITFPAHIVDNAAKMVTKGRLVLVSGELELREYEKDGQKHQAIEVRVEDYQLLDPKPEGAAE